jgi:hypothetical protein
MRTDPRPKKFTAIHVNDEVREHVGTFKEFCEIHNFPYAVLSKVAGKCFSPDFNWNSWKFTKQ